MAYAASIADIIAQATIERTLQGDGTLFSATGYPIFDRARLISSTDAESGSNTMETVLLENTASTESTPFMEESPFSMRPEHAAQDIPPTLKTILSAVI